MQIKRADAMGMCFGVRDALLAIEQVAEPAAVTIHGELVHNGEVLRMLDARGFRQSGEASRGVPETEGVLITAHGVSERERRRLRAAGKRLIDTTCPLVHKAHEAAQLLQADARRVVVLGRRDHVEVRGIVEDLRDPIVVRDERDVATWPDERLGVVCQTTTPSERVDALMAAIRRANPHADVRLIDTVCNPTKARGAALEALLPQVDALVVVGGRDSNNTRQLVLRAERRGVAALHIENEAELDEGWLSGRRVVGLTAGTSTLPATIDAVHARLLAIAARATAGSP
ncbi:MAG: 4-hydroxy-3-methylbut-2-enyl diphosphate reductase [Planctomycetes bacterium]|nr:4-hydroxy-3-methylbut-2-enyl diphosphate reductase [Planctomycetota bacterium]